MLSAALQVQYSLILITICCSRRTKVSTMDISNREMTNRVCVKVRGIQRTRMKGEIEAQTATQTAVVTSFVALIVAIIWLG